MRRLVVLVLFFVSCGRGDDVVAPRTDAISAPPPLVNTEPLGTTTGELTVGSDGIARYVMPLELPPARLTPSLSFGYASTDAVGIMGRGWSLGGISAISRCPRTIATDGVRRAVQYDATDAFCLDGQRLIQVGTTTDGRTEYRTERHSLVRVFAFDGHTHFEVWQPSGDVLTYGGLENSDVPLSDESTIAGWLLSHRKDTFGNHIRYIYSQPIYPSEPGPRGSIGEVLLDRIEYASHDSGLLADREVRFAYTDRPDPASGFRAGLAYQSTKQLSLVSTWFQGALVREYRLTYENDGPTRASRLVSVRDCVDAPADPADLDGGLICRPATTFEWSVGDETAPFEFRAGYWDTSVYRVATGFGQVQEVTPMAILDMNGDGISDFAYIDYREVGGEEEFALRVRLGYPADPLSGLTEIHTSITGPHLTFSAGRQYYPMDYDNDGRDDLLVFGSLTQEQFAVEVWRSTGSDFEVIETGLTFVAPGATHWDGEVLTKFYATAIGAETVYAVEEEVLEISDYLDLSRSFVADFDGDSVPDVMSCEVFVEQSCLTSSGTGWPDNGDPVPGFAGCPGTWTFAAGVAGGGFAPAVDTGIDTICKLNRLRVNQAQVGELTGDGVADILFIPGGDLGRYNTLSWNQATGAFEAVPLEESSGAPVNWQDNIFPTLVDVNGDGLSDLVTRSLHPADVDPTSTISAIVAYFDGVQARFVRDVRLAQGDGTFSSRVDVAPAQQWTWLGNHRSVRYFDGAGGDTFVPDYDVATDINRDGRGDLFALSHPPAEVVATNDGTIAPYYTWWPSFDTSIFSSTGQNFEIEADLMTLRAGYLQAIAVTESVTGTRSIVDTRHQFLDADGDGDVDLLAYELNSFDPAAPEEAPSGGRFDLHLNHRAQPERIVAVTNGRGARHEVDYAPMSDSAMYTPAHDCAWPQQCETGSRQLVKEVRWESGLSESRRTTYKYWGSRVDLLGRGWVGFAKRSTTDHASGLITTYHYDNETRDPSTGTYWKASFPYRVTHLLEADQASSFPDASLRTLGTVVDTELAFHDHGDGRFSTVVSEQTRREYQRMTYDALDGEAVDLFAGLTPLYTTTESYQFGDGGVHWTLSDLPHQRSVVHAGGDVEEQTWTYHLPPAASEGSPPLSPYFAGQIDEDTYQSPSDGCGAFVANRYVYDPAHGRLVHHERQPDGIVPPRSAEQRARELRHVYFDYDAYGNQTHERVVDVDDNERVSEVVFDGSTSWTFPIGVVNAEGHATQLFYYEPFGLLRGDVDPNGLETWMQFDGFGRLAAIERPAGNDLTVTYAPASGNDINITVRELGGQQVIQRVDVLGREVINIHRGFDETGLKKVYQNTAYDVLGRVTTISEPYYAGTSPSRHATYQYDQLGVLREVAGFATGQVRQMWREPASRYERDAEGNVATLYLDGRGNVTSTVEPTGGTTISMTYCADGRLRTSTDGAGNTTTVGYDTLGRQAALDEANTGFQEMRYDAFDDLVYTQDARGIETHYEYDRLSRLLQRLDDAIAVTSFLYDVPGVGLGRLAEATSPDGVTTSFGYDVDGQLDVAEQTVDGDSFRFEYLYDGRGRLRNITYPDVTGSGGFRVRNYYTSYGHLDNVVDTSTGAKLWEAIDHDAYGNLEKEWFGNGMGGFNTYEPGTSRVTEQAVVGPIGGTPQTILHLEYQHDLNGDLLQRTDNVVGYSESYAYDFNRRLTQVDPSSGATTQFQYDQLGNLTWSTDEGTQEYAGPRPHAVTRFRGVPQSYDANGNHLGDGARRTVAYNYLNKPDQIERHSDGSVSTIRYDAFGQRAVVDGDFGRTVYFGDYELRGNTAVFHVRGAGKVVAEVLQKAGNPATRAIAFPHLDNMGSVDSITGDGVVLAKHSYSAFGRHRTMPWTFETGSYVPNLDAGYTGHEHDDEFELIHMRGREYDPEMRRMTRADPYVPDPFLGQAHNRYSYVLNSPTNLIDPNGFNPKVVINFTPDEGSVVIGVPAAHRSSDFINPSQLADDVVHRAAVNVRRWMDYDPWPNSNNLGLWVGPNAPHMLGMALVHTAGVGEVDNLATATDARASTSDRLLAGGLAVAGVLPGTHAGSVAYRFVRQNGVVRVIVQEGTRVVGRVAENRHLLRAFQRARETTRIVSNSAGQLVRRTTVPSERDLIRAAHLRAGGHLNDWHMYKPNWYRSPDRLTKIELNLVGHVGTNEGPHVTVRAFNAETGRHSVVEKIFIEGRETLW